MRIVRKCMRETTAEQKPARNAPSRSDKPSGTNGDGVLWPERPPFQSVPGATTVAVPPARASLDSCSIKR